MKLLVRSNSAIVGPLLRGSFWMTWKAGSWGTRELDEHVHRLPVSVGQPIVTLFALSTLTTVAGCQDVAMFSQSDLNEFDEDSRTAIGQCVARVERAAENQDKEQLIGASKDLAETICKVVMKAFGETAGSTSDLPSLANRALEVLKLNPSALQDRPALRKVSSGLVTAINGISELRNSDGTGHGRAAPSPIHPSHAEFVKEATLSWGRWLLGSAAQSLRVSGALKGAEDEISRGILSRGKLPELLDCIQLATLERNVQHRLGVAVGRRWSVNRTFLPLEDVIQPMAAGARDYPADFASGVMEGLILDANGHFIASEREIELAIGIGLRLPQPYRREALSHLAELVNESWVLADELTMRQIVVHLERVIAGVQGEPEVAEALDRIRQHLVETPERQNTSPEDSDAPS